MLTARITLLDGTVIDEATDLAVRPAALHFRRPRSLLPGDKDVALPLDSVRQIEYIETRADETATAELVRGPREGDIGRLPIVSKR